MISSHSVAVVTSRLRRVVTPDATWLVGLRAVLRRINSEGGRLIVGQGMAGAAFVRRAAIRLDVPFVLAACDAGTRENEGELPQRDRLVLESAETVFVLALRNHGNLHRLLRERLQTRSAATVLVDLPDLQAETARTELLALGATAWRPSETQCQPFDRQLGAVDGIREHDVEPKSVYEIAAFPLTANCDLLTHTTRSCAGPWPDESFDSYADSLLESRPDADHSALGTLRRIVAQRRLLASGQTIRGGHCVVSFTACPLSELSSLQTFRRHRVRWDFEPYGLCIRKDWLQNRGARPVRYADDAGWQSLSEADRPFFQIASAGTVIDWTVEREWRFPGDLDLSELSPEDALLFVPDFESAKLIATLSPWPVTLAPSADT